MHGQKDNIKKIKLAIVVTVPSFFVHLINNIKEYEKEGFDVELISSEDEYGTYLAQHHGFKLHYINIPRDISLKQDIETLWKLYKRFKEQKYDIVHSGTPKAGLLCSVAGLLARVPVRIHTFTGQRWATLQGTLRKLLKFLDTLVIKLNTRCYADSPSQIQFLVDQGVASKKELFCLNKGSFGGVDTDFFNKARYPNARKDIAQKYGIPTDQPWALFVGRVTRDKGIHELIEAFLGALQTVKAQLIVLGEFENILTESDRHIVDTIKTHPNIKYVGFQKNPEIFMAASDFLCLPSYREGFGTVIIESASSGICSIGTDIPGLQDSVVNNQTGILVPEKDAQSLKSSFMKLFEDQNLRARMSQNARERATRDFDFKIISKLQMAEYKSLLDT